MTHERPTDLLSKIAIVIAIVGAVFAVILVASMWADYDLALSGGIDLEDTGQVGDFIGGVVGSMWALAGVLLFYSALRLQRQEFTLQRKELRDQKQEFTVNRITGIIYRQLEIVEKSASQIVLNHYRGGALSGEYRGEELFTAISEGLFEDGNPNTGNFERFAQEQATLSHAASLNRTLTLCSNLIDQRKPAADLEPGGSVFVVDDISRHALYEIVSSNLNALLLESYFEKLEKIHQELWEKKGQPGFGDFYLSQISNCRKLLIQSAFPSSAVPLAQDSITPKE